MRPHRSSARAQSATALLLVVLTLPACSNRQLHEAGRASMESRCMQIGNRDERARCEAAAGEGFDAWSRDYESAAGADDPAGDAP